MLRLSGALVRTVGCAMVGSSDGTSIRTVHGTRGAVTMNQKPYMMPRKTNTTKIWPMSFGRVSSESSRSSLLAIEDWSGKVVP